MAKHRVTFTFDRETDRALSRTAERLSKPKSEVVREAVREYAARVDRLSEAERRRMLAVLDEHLAKIPERPVDEVDAELEAIRRARRGGGRQTSPGGR